jgi:hypothetical protein
LKVNSFQAEVKVTLDGRQLRSLFKQFNEQYFDGRLPAYAIHVVPCMTSLNESARCLKKRRLIEIRCMSDENQTGILLHEMAHAATSEHHGTRWKKEMIRLREAGAPLVAADMDVSMDDWDGKRISRAHFRRVVRDALTDVPEITLRDAVRRFIYWEGGAKTASEFIKKCPWAGSLFKHEKQMHIEYLRRRDEVRAAFQANTDGTTIPRTSQTSHQPITPSSHSGKAGHP